MMPFCGFILSFLCTTFLCKNLAKKLFFAFNQKEENFLVEFSGIRKADMGEAERGFR
jgi:hypothetical protein